MTRPIDHKQLLADARIVSTPSAAAPRACTDRGFELPSVLYIAMAVLFLGFVSVLCLAFKTPGLAVPYGVFVSPRCNVRRCPSRANSVHSASSSAAQAARLRTAQVSHWRDSRRMPDI